jgi:uncharacterized protein YutE (UPF0331/DUF86 family)
MYFVDREKIEQILNYIDKLLREFDQHSFNSPLEKLSLERLVHMIIESTVDVGNMMIDGFIMRDPGSYEDIIDILVDEKVIPASDQESYKEVIKLRSTVVRDYIEIDHRLLQETIISRKSALDQFSSYIRTYLNNELGVAHAFSNDGTR